MFPRRVDEKCALEVAVYRLSFCMPLAAIFAVISALAAADTRTARSKRARFELVNHVF